MTNNPIRTMRSDMIKKGFERAPHRSLLRATGVIQSEDDWNKPFIAIANSYIDIIPGHAHLNVFGEVVRAAVRAAGGVPFMFNTIGVDDGIAMGHAGMKYSLPSRELIADSVETMIAAHCFDGMICIPNCDKIVPGMLMAAMRLNIPTIFISGGPMMAGVTPSGKVVDLISVFEGVGAYRSGKIDDAGLNELEQFGCPTCGSCSGMFTANSMNCLCEALGMALPGNGTILAVDPSAPHRMNPRREELARAAARQLLNLIDLDLKPPRHRHRRCDRQRVCAGHGDGRLDQHRAAHPGAGARGRRRVSAGAAERGRGAGAEHLQGVAFVELPHRGRGQGGRRLGHPVGVVEAAGHPAHRHEDGDGQDAAGERAGRGEPGQGVHPAAGRTRTASAAGWRSSSATWRPTAR